MLTLFDLELRSLVIKSWPFRHSHAFHALIAGRNRFAVFDSGGTSHGGGRNHRHFTISQFPLILADDEHLGSAKIHDGGRAENHQSEMTLSPVMA